MRLLLQKDEKNPEKTTIYVKLILLFHRFIYELTLLPKMWNTALRNVL